MFLFSTRLAIIASLIISCGTTYPVSNNGSSTTPSAKTNTAYNASELQKDILYYINQYRSSLGKKPMTFVDAANVQADVHSANMASGKTTFGHDGFEQRIATIAKTLGQVNAAAENVAYGNLSAKAVVDGWIKSPGHKKNIEGDYNLTGIGTARNSKGVIYFTQIFLRK
jgi:uncharacterized protein YkwD